MSRRNNKPKTVAMTYRMLKADHDALSQYCSLSRISMQHFIDGAVATAIRKYGVHDEQWQG
jgi:hypothetical protein